MLHERASFTSRPLDGAVFQVQTSYAANRRAKKALTMHLTSMQGVCLERFQAANGERWDTVTDTRPYHEAFPLESIVYLSSESDNVLGELDDTKVCGEGFSAIFSVLSLPRFCTWW
jgi:hypothetical protein